MNLKEFLEATKGEPGINLHRISQKTGVSYSTLMKHVHEGHALARATAIKIAAFDPRMTSADVLELPDAVPAPAQEPTKRKPRRKAA